MQHAKSLYIRSLAAIHLLHDLMIRFSQSSKRGSWLVQQEVNKNCSSYAGLSHLYDVSYESTALMKCQSAVFKCERTLNVAEITD